MSPRSIGLDQQLNDYVVEHTSAPGEVELALIERTQSMRAGGMQIAPEQGEFLAMLVELLRPRLIVEVGTFTGYSALAMATALDRIDPDGTSRIICCDVSEEWTAIGREHWKRAGVADRIDLRIAPAIDTLRALPEDTVIDLAFVDADKGGYGTYVDAILDRLADDGLILVDNTLWSGAVVKRRDRSDDTEAIRAFNAAIAADERVRQVLLPIGDGVTAIRRAR
ncbi:MAG: class I SAM-dependent methyltransferase [Actinomycetota bacterium]